MGCSNNPTYLVVLVEIEVHGEFRVIGMSSEFESVQLVEMTLCDTVLPNERCKVPNLGYGPMGTRS